MTDDERTPLQRTIAEAIASSGRTRDNIDTALRKRLETTGKPLWDIERGKTRRPGPRILRAIEDELGFGHDALVDLVHPSGRQGLPAAAGSETDTLMVGIQHIDMAYGLGTTFAMDHPEVEVLLFPTQWIRTITTSPPAMLTWTRGKGDSMEPTIRDGDLVLLDRSQRAITERDAMWAFTIGEEAAIKRLRRQGERCEILSDNKSVPTDEQLLRDINIVGRVVFVGSRK